MERCHPKRLGVAAGVLSLLLWLLVSSDHTDPAAQVAPDVRNQSFASHERIAEVVGLEGEGGAEVEREAGPAGDRAALDQPRPDPVSLPISAPEDSRRSPASHDASLLPSSIAAPDVEVRVGEHGDFERVVFEWPESIEHAVVQHADEVVIAFARPGRIDLSKLREGFGRRLVEAWADGGDASRQVVLRVLPEVTIRSFSLESDRIVVIDLLGEPASRRAASPATETEPAAAAGTRREGTARHGRIGIDHEHLQWNGRAAPNVDVRAGDHGDFERIVFEWPERIAHNVAQRGEQVTVAFSRPGRIDLSGVRHRLNGRVLDVWADGDDATSQVTLRVSQDAEIRSFALKGDRVVVVDVFGGSTAQGPTRPGPDLAQVPIGELRRELEQRDAVIDGLLARVEQLERGAVLSGDDLDRIAAGRTPSPGDRSLPQPGATSVAAAEPPPSGPASQQEAPTAGENQARAPPPRRSQANSRWSTKRSTAHSNARWCKRASCCCPWAKPRSSPP